VKIDTRQIPDEGLILTEEFSPAELDLDTEIVKFGVALKARAEVTKSYGAVSVVLGLSAPMLIYCSRCLKELDTPMKKHLMLSYPLDNQEQFIDLSPEIREEIIVGMPMKPLCKPGCKGLCPKCGHNLNESNCGCKQ